MDLDKVIQNILQLFDTTDIQISTKMIHQRLFKNMNSLEDYMKTCMALVHLLQKNIIKKILRTSISTIFDDSELKVWTRK